jgi:hypothetical protein
MKVRLGERVRPEDLPTPLAAGWLLADCWRPALDPHPGAAPGEALKASAAER